MYGKGNMTAVLKWWLALLFIGVAFMPLTGAVFQRFADRGWLFSKIIGLLLSGWSLWCLVSAELLPFTGGSALLITALLTAVNWGTMLLVRSLHGAEKRVHLRFPEVRTVAAEEILFLFLMLLGMYVIGFRPEAKGTEKFMDYSFLTAMERSTKLPFEDTWFAGETVNYYYGGQYAAAFLMKLTGVSAGLAYNAMRALVTAGSFMLPCSLVCQMLSDRLRESAGRKSSVRGGCSWAGGLLAGLASAFCGTGHYLVYGLPEAVRSLLTGEEDSYWFASATRYIGYDPDLPDKTIHEFPAYSSILGDLHAHYVNLIFVFTVLAVAYAWAQKQSRKRRERFPVVRLEIVLIGIFTGLFRWTNAADFPVCYVICGSILFFVNLRTYRGERLRFCMVTAGQAAAVFLIGAAAAYPFTSSFSEFIQGYGLTHSHTLLRQLAVLWGLPTCIFLGFLLRLICERRKKTAGLRLAIPDLTALLFGLCALGLVLLPELVYVKDIYGAEYYRANTMFKLTYCAFLLFAIVMPYVLVSGAAVGKYRLRLNGKTAILNRVEGAARASALVLLLLTAGYTVRGVSSWFGSILIPGDRIGSDASVFIEEDYPSDAEAIAWLRENVEGTPVLLEAPGDSYSDYARISVATGLPTVLGWVTHEWLWRNDYEIVRQRNEEAEQIYTSEDHALVETLIEKYNISYLYIGALEREKYPELNEKGLRELGKVVWESEDGVTCVIEVSK